MNRHTQYRTEQLPGALLQLLEAKGYSPGTLGNYRRVLSRLSTFMKRNGFEEYTEAVSEAFYMEYASNQNISKPYQRQIQTVLRRLKELHCGAEFLLTKQTPVPEVPTQFAGLMNAYLESCSHLGNKETTIVGKRRFCCEFLRCLADTGCGDTRGINANRICQATLMNWSE